MITLLSHTKKLIASTPLILALAIPGTSGTISYDQHRLPAIEFALSRPREVNALLVPSKPIPQRPRPSSSAKPAAGPAPVTNTGAKHHRLSETYNPIIHKAADAYKIDPALIKAVIMAESRYNPNAVSKRGARGLMQLMPATAESLGVTDLFNPKDNIFGGALYLKTLIDKFNGDIKLALAAYNAGSRYVKKYGGVPPFKQTRLYLSKVFKYHQLFKEDT